MGRTSISVFDSPFVGSNTANPLCGTIVKKYESMGNIIQALLSTSLDDKDVLPGNPVVINNLVTGSGTNQATGMNADTMEISALATTAVDGFLLCSMMDYQDDDGGVPYPHVGLLANVATYGSGVETWLPCDSALSGVALSTPLWWNTTNLYLAEVTDTGTQNTLPIKMVSAVVDGYYQFKNATSGLVEWISTKCVRVKF